MYFGCPKVEDLYSKTSFFVAFHFKIMELTRETILVLFPFG